MKDECLKCGGEVNTQYTLWAKCKRFCIANLEVYLVTTLKGLILKYSLMEKIIYHRHKKFQEASKSP